ALKLGAGQVQRKPEAPQPASEIGVQLAHRLGQQRVAAVRRGAGSSECHELNRADSRRAGRQPQPEISRERLFLRLRHAESASRERCTREYTSASRSVYFCESRHSLVIIVPIRFYAPKAFRTQFRRGEEDLSAQA